MINIAIFASGNGSNAERIINYFCDNNKFKIRTIISNRQNAYVLQRAKNHNIPSFVLNKEDFQNDTVIQILKENAIDFIVLAGFLLKISPEIVTLYPNKIINIHPALLPNYGGKGMYGMNVHKAILDNNECESGITIHYVNEHYDKGNIIFQARCGLTKEDTPETLAEKIHLLEYEHFPIEIMKILNKTF